MKREIKIGSWAVQTSDTTLTMGPGESAALTEIAARWIDTFPRDPETLAWRELGVPSALIRFDYVLGGDGTPRVFEVEDRPAGLAINSVVCPGFPDRFRRSLDAIREALGRPVELFVTDSRRETCDDPLLPDVAPGAFDAVRVGGTPSSGAAIFVRCALGESGLGHLEERSVSTISREGDKSYGVPLGMWREIDSREPLDWEQSFALKPERGCGSRGVVIYRPSGGAGFEKKSRVARAVLENRVRFVQPYHEPERSPDGDGTMMIRRVLFAWSPTSGRYEPLGGSWNARPCVKVHGASDTVTGPILPPA